MSFAFAEELLTGPSLKRVEYPRTKQTFKSNLRDLLKAHTREALTREFLAVTTVDPYGPVWGKALLWSPVVTDRHSFVLPFTAVDQAEQIEESVESGVTVPQWTLPALSAVIQHQSLPVNWDTYGGLPVSDFHAEVAWRFLTEVMRDGLPLPDFIPLPDGGLQMEWNLGPTRISFASDDESECALWVTTSSGVEDVAPDAAPALFDQYAERSPAPV